MIKIEDFTDDEIYSGFIAMCGRYAVLNKIPLMDAELFANQLTFIRKPITGPTSLSKRITIAPVNTKERLISSIKEYCENRKDTIDAVDAIYQFITELYDLCRAVMIESHLHHITYNKHKDVDLKPYRDKKHEK